MSDGKDWVAEARERCEAAAEGPWKVDVGMYQDPDGDDDLGFGRTPMVTRKKGETYEQFKARCSKGDAAFIAAARSDLPRALDVIEAADRLAEAWVDYERVYYLQASLPPEQITDWAQGVMDCEMSVKDALAAYRKVRG